MIICGKSYRWVITSPPCVHSLYAKAYTRVMINGFFKWAILSHQRRLARGPALLPLVQSRHWISSCKSTIWGFKAPGKTDCLITFLFTDDTTVFLSDHDDFDCLQSIPAKWCLASGAKFNIEKTEIIPLGNKDYCHQLYSTRALNLDQPQATIPSHLHITKDGESIRILGGQIGNNMNQKEVWTPCLEKIQQRLIRCSEAKPTLEANHHLL